MCGSERGLLQFRYSPGYIVLLCRQPFDQVRVRKAVFDVFLGTLATGNTDATQQCGSWVHFNLEECQSVFIVSWATPAALITVALKYFNASLGG